MAKTEETVTTRRVSFLPAWDRFDPDPRLNRGVHGVEIRFVLTEGDWAFELIIMTPWVLPKTQEVWDAKLNHRPRECIAATAHHRNGPDADNAGVCPVFSDAPCQEVRISYSAGDACFDALVAGGEEACWAAMQTALDFIRND